MSMSSNFLQALNLDEKKKMNQSTGAWKFIDSLSQGSEYPNNAQHVDSNNVYVHPLFKPPTSRLSQRSLEMCTESLGSESGSSRCEELEDFRSGDGGRELITATNTKKKPTYGSGFPPPLKSIGGSNGGVKVSPHREGGRLVIKAVAIPEIQNFCADRSEGRLRLHLVTDKFVEKIEVRDEKTEVDEEEKSENDEEKKAEEEGVCDWWMEEIEGGDNGGMRRCGVSYPFWSAPLYKPISQF